MIRIFTLLLLFAALPATAQRIAGSVSDAATGSAIAGATVTLIGTGTGTVTDSAGQFSMQGRGTIQVSYMGYKTARLQASPDYMRIELQSAASQLQTVEVTGRAAKDYNSDYSFSATRVSALNKDIPQSIASITKELMADRQAFQLADAVKIASGVIPSSYYNQYTIRGISQNK